MDTNNTDALIDAIRTLLELENENTLSRGELCNKYGIEYENPNNLFRSVLVLGPYGNLGPGKFYFYKDLLAVPELESFLSEYEKKLMQIKEISKKTGTVSDIKKHKYNKELQKIESKIKSVEKEKNIHSLSVIEKDNYIANYNFNIDNEIRDARKNHSDSKKSISECSIDFDGLLDGMLNGK